MARSDYRLTHPLRVRFVEVDRAGVVFNANFLSYFDVAFTEYWRAIGYPYPDGILELEGGGELYVVKATIEYRAFALFDDVLDISLRCARIGRSSMRFLPEIYRGEELITMGELIYAHVDPSTRRAVPVPEVIRQAILKFELIPPAF